MPGLKLMSRNPDGFKMMNDPHVNYYEAVREFNEFWKDKEKPLEEKEIFNAKEKTKSVRKVSPEIQQLSFEYKKFLHWKRKVEPFVKEDGSIPSSEEMLKIWEQEKANRERSEQN
jgi:hypothetical protein